MKPIKYLKEFEEFETVGFVKSQPGLLNQLRRRYGTCLKIFCPGNSLSIGKGDAKYGVYHILGDRMCYYYHAEKEDDFVNFLVKKFLEKNPGHNSEVRKAFTRVLHYYGLCWAGCVHEGKKRFY